MAGRKVDFVIAGTQKGGTTALDFYLREHPEICMAEKKEVHFFDDERQFGGKPRYDSYHSSFRPTGGHRILGEVTPIYMYWYASPRRMWDYNPAFKILIVLRNPIERAYSHWNMQRQRGADGLGFMEAVSQEAHRCRTALPLQHRIHSYVDRGFYTEQLRRLWSFFPASQTLILKNEQLREDPEGTLDAVCGFLGVGKLDGVERREVFRTGYAEPLPDEARRHLVAIYRWEVRELERLLGWDCSAWVEY